MMLRPPSKKTGQPKPFGGGAKWAKEESKLTPGMRRWLEFASQPPSEI